MAQSILLEKSDGKFEFWRGRTTYAHTEVATTTSTKAALAANDNRKYALFINDSDTAIYLMVGANAAENKGIRLNSNGGSFEMSQGKNLDTRVVNAIHGDTGEKNLLVIEGV